MSRLTPISFVSSLVSVRPTRRHTIFLTLAGSQAHGTARVGSDVDLRGVCVAPKALRLSLFDKFEQYSGVLPDPLQELLHTSLAGHPTAASALAVKTECVIYDVAKFLILCANANPNALEILFADPDDWVIDTPAWQRLHAARHQFLTRKVQQTFMGYGMAQLKRIKTHRSWLLQPPRGRPSREAFGLPDAAGTLGRDIENRLEQSIADTLRNYGVDDLDLPKAERIAIQERMTAFHRDVLGVSESQLAERMRAVVTHALHLPPDVAAALNAEKRYRAAVRHWDAFQTWKRNRNPARAALEREHGYDTKHAMHLVRLMRMGHEVLQHGELYVRRQDAAELAAIRDGSLSYDALLEEAERLQSEMTRAAAHTTLPADVDREQINQLATALMLDSG